MELDNQTAGQEIVQDAAVTDAPVADAEVKDNAELPEAEGDNAPDNDEGTELHKIRKALEKRNRYNNNLRNRIRSLEAEIEKTKNNSANKQAAPELEKFDSVLDYMKADQNFNLDQKLAEQAQKAQIAALEQQQSAAVNQHVEAVAAQVSELLTSNPDFKSVVTSNAQVIDAMPDHIEKMFLEIDDAPAATYALAKEGRLASIYSMPPHLAAAHIVQAEIRGQQYLRQASKPQTQPLQTMQPTQQAPKPIGSLRGTGKSNKSLGDLSPDEIVKRYIK
jgi:hypothetical protein